MKCKNCESITPIWGGKHKKYCNLKCQRDYENKTSKKIFDPINCVFCEKEFVPVSKANILCSTYCKRKHDLTKRTNKPKVKYCKFCNKEYKPYTSLDKFCSANCRTDSMKSKRKSNWTKEQIEKRLGSNNPAYRHGMACFGVKKNGEGLRLFRRNRDEMKQEMMDNYGFLFCERCNISNTRFETHHIIYRSEKPKHTHLHDKRNLIHLCVPCHNFFHNKKSNRNSLVEQRGLHELFGNDVLDK